MTEPPAAIGHEVCKVKGGDVAGANAVGTSAEPKRSQANHSLCGLPVKGRSKIMKKMWFIAALAVSAGALPAVAEAAAAFSTANVNMRSGPSTRYPAVIVVPAGSRVNIQGCMSSANWCDVSFAGYRGWVSGSYLQTTYSQRRVSVGPQYYRPLGIPTVTFSVGRYWDDHYRNRPFYRDRDRWRDGDGWRDDRRDRDRDRRVDNDRRGRDDDRRVRREAEPQDDRDRNPVFRMRAERCERNPSACR
jgi:uncharacterized protein YraI